MFALEAIVPRASTSIVHGLGLEIIVYQLPVQLRVLCVWPMKCRAETDYPRVSQSRPQSPRYPCPAERENERLWDNLFEITGFLLFRLHCAGVSV